MNRELACRDGLKLLIWTGIPTHHQAGFFAALRARNVDLIVHYYSRVDDQRQRHGWSDPAVLPDGESYVLASLEALYRCADWRERIHIIPGYAKPFLLKLATTLSHAGVPWLHWSEPSRVMVKSLFTYPLKRFYAELVNRRALGALAIGDCARRDFIRWGIRDEKIRFLPYAIPAPHCSDPVPPESPPRERPDGPMPTLSAVRFAFVGALCHRKGVDVLLQAFKRVLAAYPSARLELVGYDESAGRYARLSDRLGLSDAVRFTGSVPAGDIATVFTRCDVFVLPSRFDGWGVVLNEAAALGKALISTEPTGAAHHLLAPGVNGYRVPASDDVALAQAMMRYCRAPELAAMHGARSQALFLEFTPERNAARLAQAIDSLWPARRPSLPA
jgi:glycosyltransferase involved in cell wall biosynthesis